MRTLAFSLPFVSHQSRLAWGRRNTAWRSFVGSCYRRRVIFPAPLEPGDTVAVVAPSGPFDRAAALAGIAWLARRYRVVYGRTLFSRVGYLAGSDRRRLAELQKALDADVQAVVAARGGYGLGRIAALVDWRRALRRPKWLIGFSDFTVLHAESWRRGLASLHAPMVCALGSATRTMRRHWIETLEDPMRQRRWTGLTRWHGGRAMGTFVGGNLAILHSMAAAGRLHVPKNAVVFLEDIGERPYRVDRMLTDLLAGGHLGRAAGVVVGDFTDCVAGADRRKVDDVLRERLSTLGVPVATGFPAGHGKHNDAVVFGHRARLDASRGVLTLG
jgi:muramoyltetrapeptide carboxypeptidase